MIKEEDKSFSGLVIGVELINFDHSNPKDVVAYSLIMCLMVI
jgi:hypothetical protein